MVTNDDLLATLRRWDAEATKPSGHIVFPSRCVCVSCEAKARLATLVHEILPLAEALVVEHRAYVRSYRDWEGHRADAAVCNACPVLDRIRERVAALGAP